MLRHLLPIMIKPSRRSTRRSLDPWTSPSRGALHYEGLRRGILFFAALLSLILPVAVAARCARPEPGISGAGAANPAHAAAAPLGAVLLVMPRSADRRPR